MPYHNMTPHTAGMLLSAQAALHHRNTGDPGEFLRRQDIREEYGIDDRGMLAGTGAECNRPDLIRPADKAGRISA
jgi:hypothetical protein